MRASFAFGVFCAVAGAALWGFSGACAQFLFAGYEISALFITVVRMLGAGVLFAIVLVARWRNDLKRLLVFGSFGLFLDQFAYIMTIGFTNAGTATVLQGLNMVFVVVTTCLIVRRRPHAREVAGVVCALAATVLIATGGELGSLKMPVPGLAWGIVNAAAVAFYVMYPQRLFAQWGSVAVTGLGMLFGGLVALVVFLAQGVAAADWAGLVLMIVTIVLVSVHPKTSGARP